MFENCYLMLIYFNNKKNKQILKPKVLENKQILKPKILKKKEEKIIEYKDIFSNKLFFHR